MPWLLAVPVLLPVAEPLAPLVVERWRWVDFMLPSVVPELLPDMAVPAFMPVPDAVLPLDCDIEPDVWPPPAAALRRILRLGGTDRGSEGEEQACENAHFKIEKGARPDRRALAFTDWRRFWCWR